MKNDVSRETLVAFVSEVLGGSEIGDALSSVLSIPSAKHAWGEVATGQNVLPEVQVYVHLLVVVHLLAAGESEACVGAARALEAYVTSLNRFTVVPLAAKMYYYLARAYEAAGDIGGCRGLLLAAVRRAALRAEDDVAAVAINALLRSYLARSQYDQAHKLVMNTTFPASVSSNQVARYHYYMGRIAAVQLKYADAHTFLSEALRKAPQHTGHGFRAAIHKVHTVVYLLRGELPVKATFRSALFASTLEPYLELTKAVRVGDLKAFQAVLETHGSVFETDRVASLIARLRQNVLRTGLRKINLAYSRISLDAIAQKLGLGERADVEFIVAKAIRDGVMDAAVDAESGVVTTNDVPDVYATYAPLDELGTRIAFCLKIHDDAVRAMRYPDDGKKKNPGASAADDEDEISDMDLVEELLEEDDDEPMDEL